MTAIIVGSIFVLLGLWALVNNVPEFVLFIKGFGPITLIIGGIFALIMGFASFRRSKELEDVKKK